MEIMHKDDRKVIWVYFIYPLLMLMLLLFLIGCSSFQLSTLNHKPNYFNNKIVINKINSMNELKRQMHKDWNLKNNYLQFALNQDINWYYEFYYTNSLYRKGFSSAYDFYWNRNHIWWNWSFNSHNWWGHEWYKPYYWLNDYNIAFVKGRRNNTRIDLIADNLNNQIKKRNLNTRNYNISRNDYNNYNNNNYINTNNNSVSSVKVPDIVTRPSSDVLMKNKN